MRGDRPVTDENPDVVAGQLVDRMSKVLAGHPPEIQGAALADCLAIWVAGHLPALRERALQLHLEFVRDLIPENARRIRGG
jgi:hypothetical protein